MNDADSFQKIKAIKLGLNRFQLSALAVLVLVLTSVGTPCSPQPEAASPVEDTVYYLCTELPDEEILGAAGDPDLFWVGKRQLRVGFDGGTEVQRQMVRQYAVTWNAYTQLPFVFVDQQPCEIRVSFKPGSSWSYIGNSAEGRAPTMNLGWIEKGTREDLIRGTILHEFGHALGLIHEHQSPAARIQWRRDVVYRIYWEEFRWNHAKVDKNILEKYPTTQFTAYDPTSIMQYPIDARLTVDGFSTPWHDRLSQTDRDFVRQKIHYIPK